MEDRTYIHGTLNITNEIADICGVAERTARGSPLTSFEQRTRLAQAFYVGVAWFDSCRKAVAVREELTSYFHEGVLPDFEILERRGKLTAQSGRNLGSIWAQSGNEQVDIA